MTNYTKSTDFAVKDVLLTGNPNKLVKGSEVDVEFSNMELADATNVKKTGTTGSAVMPTGTTAQRDASPAVGYTRVNTTSSTLEWWDGTIWTSANGGDAYDLEVTTATAGQTVITTASSFVVGSHTLMVYLNGLLVNKTSDYTETTTNSFTFNSGLTAGDEVVAQIWRTNIATSGDALTVSYAPAGTGAVATTVQAKLREFVSVKDFGAVGDGTTDDTTAIQAAITAAAALGNAYLWLSPASTYKCASGLTLDTNKVGIIGNGAVLSFATMTTGDAITIAQSNADANVRNYVNHVHPIEGVVFVGPGVATTAVRCFYFNDSASPNTISGGIVKNCAFVNFAKDVTLASGAFCITFEKCNFTILSGTPSTYSVEILTGYTNGGERNIFRDCMWNNRNYQFTQTATDADTYFDNCSFDGHSRAMTITGGLVTVSNAHIESTLDTDYFFSVSGTNALFNLFGGTTQIAANKATSAFYCDSTCTTGGIVIRDHAYWFTGSTHTANLIAGTGRTDVAGLPQFASATKPAISSYQNILAYGGFESANYTAEWTLASGAVRSTTLARTGTYSLSLPSSSGVTPSAYCTIPCTAGQRVQGEYWYQVPAITGTSGSFYVQIDYLDKAGNVISNAYGVALTTTNVSTWTQARLGLAPAPTGTVSVKLFFNIFGTASGAPIAYIDDVLIAVV